MYHDGLSNGSKSLTHATCSVVYLRKGVDKTLDEHEQELSMIHVGVGKWILGIDLVGKDSVTRNPLGFVYITGEESLYYMAVEEEEEELKEGKDLDKVKEIRRVVQDVAEELDVPTDRLIEAVIKIGTVFREKGIAFKEEEEEI